MGTQCAGSLSTDTMQFQLIWLLIAAVCLCVPAAGVQIGFGGTRGYRPPFSRVPKPAVAAYSHSVASVSASAYGGGAEVVIRTRDPIGGGSDGDQETLSVRGEAARSVTESWEQEDCRTCSI